MAITEVYVDPSINANSGTGTIGDAFGDLQYALNTKARDSTNGDRFNIKAGTAEVLTAALSLTTYGTPTATAPLVIQGYTSAAGDGGIGEISGGGSYGIYTGTGYIHFVDMKMGNCGGASIYAGTGALVRCELYSSTAQSPVFMYPSATGVYGCHIHTITASYPVRIGTGNSAGCPVIGNFIDVSPTFYGIYLNSYGNTMINNVMRFGGGDTSFYGVFAERGAIIANNTVYCTNANTGYGIASASALALSVTVNNIVAGWSGAGGIGIYAPGKLTFVSGNAVYNCTTAETLNDDTIVLEPTITLGASPFVDAANGDFSIDPASDAVGAAWPTQWYGLATTTNAADIGAVQNGAGSGGAGIYRRVMRMIKG